MSSIVSTITVPALGHPNFMHSALQGLIKNSFYKHRIIILWSNPAIILPDKCSGWDSEIVNGWDSEIIDGKQVQFYKSTQKYLADHRQWLEQNQIEFVDLTEQSIAFREKCYRDGGATIKNIEDGVDIAWKNNIGLEMTDTEWTIPNWDCDFFPAKNWDKPLFEYTKRAEPKSELIPMHVQPYYLPKTDPRYGRWDAWRDSRHIAVNRLAIPTETREPAWVTEEALELFCAITSRGGKILKERPGARDILHWVPALLRTDEVRAVGAYGYKGPGYDIEFDDRLGQNGFTKIGFCDAFVLHKGFPPIEAGVCCRK